MIRRILAFFDEQKLFRIRLGIPVLKFQVAVADSDHRKSDLAEIAQAVIGYVPAEHIFSDLIILMTFVKPLFRREITERRKADLQVIDNAFHAL